MKRSGIALLAATTALAVGVAYGDVHEQHVEYWKAPLGTDPPDPFIINPCAEGLARIAHGNYGVGFARSNTYSTSMTATGSPCSYYYHKVAGNLRTRFVYLKRDGPSNWGHCSDSNWTENTTYTYFVEKYRNWAGSTPCGVGYYKVEGHHKVQSDGAMREGATVTEKHFFDNN